MALSDLGLLSTIDEATLCDILTYLPLRDLIEVAQLSDNLATLIREKIFKEKCPKVSSQEAPFNTMNRFQFKAALKILAPNIDILLVRNEDVKLPYQIFSQVDFSLLRVFDCTDEFLRDSDMDTLSRTCPLLESMRLESMNITGQYIANIKKLKTIHLRFAELDPIEFHNIFENHLLTHISLRAIKRFTDQRILNKKTPSVEIGNGLKFFACTYLNIGPFASFLKVYPCKNLQQILLTGRARTPYPCHYYAEDWYAFSELDWKSFIQCRGHLIYNVHFAFVSDKIFNCKWINYLVGLINLKSFYQFQISQQVLLKDDILILFELLRNMHFLRKITLSPRKIDWPPAGFFNTILDIYTKKRRRFNEKLLLIVHSSEYQKCFNDKYKSSKKYLEQNVVEIRTYPDSICKSTLSVVYIDLKKNL